jgi:hypothetical protein
MRRNPRLLGGVLVASVSFGCAVTLFATGVASGQVRRTPVSTPVQGIAAARPNRPATSTPAPGAALSPAVSPPTVVPPPVTRDFAPNMPPQNKCEIVFRLRDGHEEEWLMGCSDADAVRAQLPLGATVVLGPFPLMHSAPPPRPPSVPPGTTGYPQAGTPPHAPVGTPTPVPASHVALGTPTPAR